MVCNGPKEFKRFTTTNNNVLIMTQTETITIQYTLGTETSYQAIKPKDYEKVKAKLQRLGYAVKKI